MWQEIANNGNCYTEAYDVGNGVLVKEVAYSINTGETTAIALCFVPGAFLVCGKRGRSILKSSPHNNTERR